MDRLVRESQKDQVIGQMIRLKKGQEKPEAFRLMTDNEVLQMQMKIISSWNPRSQMWPFSWGVGILGGAACLTGIFVNNICRKKLNLMTFARATTYAPTVVFPALLTTTLHNFLITNNILLGNFPCTVCAATQSGAIQVAFGAIYPVIIGPLVCIISARKYHTYAVPSVKNIAELSSFLRKTMPVAGSMLSLLLINFGLGMLISERESTLFANYLNPSLASSTEYDDEGFK